MNNEDYKNEEIREDNQESISKKELRRQIFPFLICGAAVGAVLNIFTGFPFGNVFGAALTGLVFGYVAWGFWRFFTRRS